MTDVTLTAATLPYLTEEQSVSEKLTGSWTNWLSSTLWAARAASVAALSTMSVVYCSIETSFVPLFFLKWPQHFCVSTHCLVAWKFDYKDNHVSPNTLVASLHLPVSCVLKNVMHLENTHTKNTFTLWEKYKKLFYGLQSHEKKDNTALAFTKEAPRVFSTSQEWQRKLLWLTNSTLTNYTLLRSVLVPGNLSKRESIEISYFLLIFSTFAAKATFQQGMLLFFLFFFFLKSDSLQTMQIIPMSQHTQKLLFLAC